MDLFRLDGMVAIVTGAARGIGAAIAVGIAEAGAELCLLDILPCAETAARVTGEGGRAAQIERDRHHRDTETQTAGEGEGGRVAQIEADLSGLDTARADELLTLCVEASGEPDVLVNAAGILRRSSALEHTAEDWRAVLDIDLSAVFYLSQAAARRWAARGAPGKIINIASMLSFQGGSSAVSYAAAKSGLAGLTRALANEWAPLAINVNAIAPGYIATDVTAALRADPARSERIVSRIPAGRWGGPDDIRGAAIYLASPASDYVHGAIIPVDGGWLAR